MSFCTWESDEVYKDHFQPGVYTCSECGYELFSSRQKFEHHSPWPAFSETVHKDSVIKKEEPGSRKAFKVYCGKCENPLGHEFLKDGPDKIKSRF
jgi:peptide-methionine (R)-S-oxide reductase